MSYFDKPNLAELDLYVTLGNHDCYEDFQFELDYAQVNSKWILPYDYYEIVVPLEDDPTQNLVIIVTNPCLLACFELTNGLNKKDCSKMRAELDGKASYEHKSWLESKLKHYSELNSTRWLAVTTHHPFSTEPSLKKYILPLLQKYKVDFILSGHIQGA